MSTSITRRAALTGSAAGAAAIATSPIGNAKERPSRDELALDGLPLWMQFEVKLNRLKKRPIEERRAAVARLRSGGIPEDFVQHIERDLSLEPSASAPSEEDAA